MVKVLIADKLSEKAEKIFIDKGLEVDVITGLGKEELVKIINNYDIVLFSDYGKGVFVKKLTQSLINIANSIAISINSISSNY